MILALWEGLARLYPGSFVIAGPWDVAQHLWDNTGRLARATWATTSAAIAGFVIGNLVAVLLAAFAFWLPRSERAITMLALLVFCLPLVATGPILRVLFGPGAGPQVTLAALAVYYTTYLAMLVGLRAIPQSWSDLNATYGRGRWSELIHMRAPACIPYLIAGLQIAAPVAFLGAMVGEFTGAEQGLGVLTLQAMRGLDVTASWSIALLATAISMLAYSLFGRMAVWLAPDRPALLLSNRPKGASRGFWSRLAGGLGICVLVLLLWQGAMDIFGLNSFFAKRPGDVWSYLVSGSDAAQARETLFAALLQTLSLTAMGYLAGLAMGAGLAMVVALAPVLAGAVLPLAVTLRAVPIITTAPLLVLALGRGTFGTVSIVAVMIFFPTLVACAQGLRQMPGQVADVFQSYGASRFRVLIWAQIPAMWPAFFAAARMAIPAALLAATTTEWLATGKGIGNLMALTATTSNYNMLWSATAVLALVAVICYLLVERLERRVLSHYAREQLSR